MGGRAEASKFGGFGSANELLAAPGQRQSRRLRATPSQSCPRTSLRPGARKRGRGGKGRRSSRPDPCVVIQPSSGITRRERNPCYSLDQGIFNSLPDAQVFVYLHRKESWQNTPSRKVFSLLDAFLAPCREHQGKQGKEGADRRSLSWPPAVIASGR